MAHGSHLGAYSRYGKREWTYPTLLMILSAYIPSPLSQAWFVTELRDGAAEEIEDNLSHQSIRTNKAGRFYQVKHIHALLGWNLKAQKDEMTICHYRGSGY